MFPLLDYTKLAKNNEVDIFEVVVYTVNEFKYKSVFKKRISKVGIIMLVL